MKIECKNCKGKGHIFNAISILNPIMWCMAPFETNDKAGLTRDICSHCNGNGYFNE